MKKHVECQLIVKSAQKTSQNEEELKSEDPSFAEAEKILAENEKGEGEVAKNTANSNIKTGDKKAK